MACSPYCLLTSRFERKRSRYSIGKCTFEIPHFKLHEKHRRENPMIGLKHILKLDVLWTPPPERTFTTTAGDDCLLLDLAKLQQLTINVLNRQYIRLQADLTRAEFQEEAVKKLEKIIPSLPRWITRALDAFPQRPGLKLFLVVYVAVGDEQEVLKQDLTSTIRRSPRMMVLGEKPFTKPGMEKCGIDPYFGY
ncbi:hypothetical protein LTR70_006012 [Exophiala xenobiotica]|uniref:Uncharacterized protein n=1 Tax=Lithohypha guttulata TaxID=1690604 RepID=A0ABR0KBC8_9EURO|nr:hypothetical protein LTR24_004796 [Lithohypha guttulata]KAK5316981.1 hypothetical protein LTR70_006012 [Exophiala xenobiotica]